MLTIVVQNPLWYVNYAHGVKRPIRYTSEICWHVGEPKPTIIQPSDRVLQEARVLGWLPKHMEPEDVPLRKIIEVQVDGDEIASFLRLTTYTHGGRERFVRDNVARDLYEEWMKYPT